MRTKNALVNSIGVAIVYLVKVILTFTVRTLIIKQLGDAYNGLDGLFNSVISMLAITELGIGSAIIFKLYEPVKENRVNEIKSLINFYRKCYFTIGGIVLAIGIALAPGIPFLIGELNISENIYILYFGFLLDSVLSYFFTYKQAIFIANQKNIIVSVGDFLKVIALQGLRVLLLLTVHDYTVYVYIAIPVNLFINAALGILADKRYPYLKERDISPLGKDVLIDTVKKIKGLIYHKIGGFIVLGTDNILISKFCGVITVGFYSNYILIVNTFQQLFGQMIDAVIPSIGNLLIENKKKRNYDIYKIVRMLCDCLFGVISVVFCVQVSDFINLWIGMDKTLSPIVVYFISLNFYLLGMRKPVAVFQNAAGIFYSDRWVPIFESITNLIASVLLTMRFGLVGIIVGTTISSVWVFFYDFPIFVWKEVFDEKVITYYKGLLVCLMTWHFSLALSLISKNFLSKFNTGAMVLNWIITSTIITIVVMAIYLIFYQKSEEFAYIKVLLTKHSTKTTDAK